MQPGVTLGLLTLNNLLQSGKGEQGAELGEMPRCSMYRNGHMGANHPYEVSQNIHRECSALNIIQSLLLSHNLLLWSQEKKA